MDDHHHQNHDHGVCLGLGLGLGFTPKRDRPGKNKHVLFLDLSIPLQTSTDHNGTLKIMGEDHANIRGGCIKEDDHDSKCSNGFSRKKLRLTTDQAGLLEDSFKQHTTLNTAQKQALAEKLNLKPRQVEVWFQNRRARTKLKQTEIDCEMLKKTCERLGDENRRLKKELFELRSSIEKPQSTAAAALASEPPIRFLEYSLSNSEGKKNWTARGGGKKKLEAAATAAAAVEVVHGLALVKANDEEQRKLGFVGEAKIKAE